MSEACQVSRLRQRKRDGIYEFEFKSADGDWKEKSTGTRNRKQAVDFKRKFQREMEDFGAPTELAEYRLDQAERWWNEHRQGTIAENTLNSEKYRLQHLRKIIGNKHLREITNLDLTRYQSQRLKQGLSAWSVNKEIMLWSMILDHAKLWKRLKDDYKPKKVKASDIGQALTRDQLRHLVQTALQNEDWEAALFASILAANTGLRGGEVKKLQVGKIDLEKRELKILRHVAKSDSSARYILLNADALKAATRLLERYQKICKDAGIDPKPQHFLLPMNTSRISHGALKGSKGFDPEKSQRYWDSAWGSLTEAAGFPDFRFHDLRHTFVSHMVERGVPIGVIKKMVGHISARMVEHYTHVSSGAMRQAVEKLDDDPILVGMDADAIGNSATVQ